MVSQFSAFGWQHFTPLVFFALLVFVLVRLGRNRSKAWRFRLGFALSLLIPMMVLRDLILGCWRGTIDVSEDLPLHLCRIICFFLPIAFWRKSRDWIAVLYFLILAGTLQAVITPDLVEGFPQYLYFRYWMLHAGLIAFTMYAVIISELRVTWKDFWRAVFFAQVYLMCTLPLNAVLDANYGYTCRKPPMSSIADLMGPWPWYILSGEVIMFVLYLVLYFPLRRRDQRW